MMTAGADGAVPPDPDGATSSRGDGDARDPGPDALFGSGLGRERLVQEGLDHVQRAARETIAAVRTMLDIAEEIVDDPAAAQALVATIGSLAEGAIRSGAAAARARRPGPDGKPEDDDDGGRVQRIPVS